METRKKSRFIYSACCFIVLFLIFWLEIAVAQTTNPVLFFSDITSGPRTGNTDTSLGQTSGQDGAIVTIWGRNLDNAKIYCNGAEAAFTYSSGNATSPANLFTHHKMQMISFQISHSAEEGEGGIYAVVNGQQSNSLPFTVRPGNIYFVKTSGNDDTGNGSWNNPWRTIPKVVNTLAPGDIAYVCNGVSQTTETQTDTCVYFDTDADATETNPKALVVYPGAQSTVGNSGIPRAFLGYTVHWVIAKFNIITSSIGVLGRTGFRIVGNYITAPNGDGPDGAIECDNGSNVSVLGNELSNVGSSQSSKLYHVIYVSGVRQDNKPRAQTESNKEVAWNYIHDCQANRGINMYSEGRYSAYNERHSVHDNVIVNQHGDGILLGYYVTGENWIYNNLIINAGLGPEWAGGETSSYSGIRMDCGHENVANTVVHCYNNTLYGCGWQDAPYYAREENGHLYVSQESVDRNVTINYWNNIIHSTGVSYLASLSASLSTGDYHNCWYGAGAPPDWDTGAINADPQFVDKSSNNFELAQNSPCINAGRDVSSVVKRDILGIPRPLDSVYDLGVYEYTTDEGGSPTPSPAISPTPTLPQPAPTPTPISCEPDTLVAVPAKIQIAEGSSAEEVITITCANGTPVAGESATWKITKGTSKISIVPESAVTGDDGQAVFTVTGKRKGSAKVKFLSGSLKPAKVNVKVTKQ